MNVEDEYGDFSDSRFHNFVEVDDDHIATGRLRLPDLVTTSNGAPSFLPSIHVDGLLQPDMGGATKLRLQVLGQFQRPQRRSQH